MSGFLCQFDGILKLGQKLMHKVSRAEDGEHERSLTVCPACNKVKMKFVAPDRRGKHRLFARRTRRCHEKPKYSAGSTVLPSKPIPPNADMTVAFCETFKSRKIRKPLTLRVRQKPCSPSTDQTPQHVSIPTNRRFPQPIEDGRIDQNKDILSEEIEDMLPKPMTPKVEALSWVVQSEIDRKDDTPEFIGQQESEVEPQDPSYFYRELELLCLGFFDSFIDYKANCRARVPLTIELKEHFEALEPLFRSLLSDAKQEVVPNVETVEHIQTIFEEITRLLKSCEGADSFGEPFLDLVTTDDAV